MNTTALAAAVLAALGTGGVAYVFLYPMLSGENRAAKRQQALTAPTAKADRRSERNASGNRRDQVAQSLKELEQRENARNKIPIELRIQQAGLDWSKQRFIMTSVILGAVLGAIVFFVTGGPLAGLAAAFAGGFGLPRWYIGFKKKKRINRFLEELPNAMDVVVRGIRSGLPLNDCLRIIANEAREPVRSEFRQIVEQQALGLSVADATQKLFERVPVAESNFFAIVLGIQSKAGGNLSEALSNLSRVLRERKKMKGKIQAMSQEAKASAGIIAALPFAVAILTYVTSPNYIELLWTTSVGKVALVIAAFWMLIGCAVMRKMINFDF